MPDRSTAATEHAILQQVAAPLATLPDDPMAIAAAASFPVALRGYDRAAVDAYVRRTSQLVAELHATHSPEVAVRRALERVGEEVAGVLRRAHETAEEITAQSRREADDRLQAAHREAEQIVAAARARLGTLDKDTDRIWEERRRIVEDVRDLAEELLNVADSAIERLGPEEPVPEEPGSGELGLEEPGPEESEPGELGSQDGADLTDADTRVIRVVPRDAPR